MSEAATQDEESRQFIQQINDANRMSEKIPILSISLETKRFIDEQSNKSSLPVVSTRSQEGLYTPKKTLVQTSLGTMKSTPRSNTIPAFSTPLNPTDTSKGSSKIGRFIKTPFMKSKTDANFGKEMQFDTASVKVGGGVGRDALLSPTQDARLRSTSSPITQNYAQPQISQRSIGAGGGVGGGGSQQYSHRSVASASPAVYSQRSNGRNDTTTTTTTATKNILLKSDSNLQNQIPLMPQEEITQEVQQQQQQQQKTVTQIEEEINQQSQSSREPSFSKQGSTKESDRLSTQDNNSNNNNNNNNNSPNIISSPHETNLENRGQSIFQSRQGSLKESLSQREVSFKKASSSNKLKPSMSKSSVNSVPLGTPSNHRTVSGSGAAVFVHHDVSDRNLEIPKPRKKNPKEVKSRKASLQVPKKFHPPSRSSDNGEGPLSPHRYAQQTTLSASPYVMLHTQGGRQICDTIDILCISANVGSLFESPALEFSWLVSFFSTVNTAKANLIFVHFQELGGKNWKTRDVEQVVANFISKMDLGMQAYCSSGLLFQPPVEKDSTTFTALGMIAYACPCLVLPQIIGFWNFTEGFIQPFGTPMEFEHNIRGGMFPRDLIPEFTDWGRKGYMHTQWHMNDNVIDLVNFHLFHDASNTTAMDGEDSVSIYAKCRKRAFEYVIKTVQFGEPRNAILFGDFNFRLHLKNVLDYILKSSQQEGEPETTEAPAVVGKKTFKLRPEFFKFFTRMQTNLQEHDVEKWTVLRTDGSLGINFFELPISFPPTYPYSEESSTQQKLYPFGDTRCPSWCDRVFLSANMQKRMVEEDKLYGMIGKNLVVGDHKPVYLKFTLLEN